MRRVAGQLVEIAESELQILVGMMEAKIVTDREAEQTFGDCNSLENLKTVLVETWGKTLEYLNSLSEADLQENISCHAKWFTSLSLEEVPRAEVFRSIAQHEWYQVGYLVTYCWAMGDNPYEW